MRAMLTVQPSDASGASTAAAASAPGAGADLAAVTALLDFHAARGGETDAALLALKKEVALAERAVAACERAVRELDPAGRQGHVNRFGGGGGGSGGAAMTTAMTTASRDVSILFSTRKEAAVVLRLTYNVSSARWTPSYDLRVAQSTTAAAPAAAASGGDATAEASAAGGSKASLQLTYFGMVRQSSGEDWGPACKLALSTATPSVGGTPPAPPTRTVAFKSPYGHQRAQHLQRNVTLLQAEMPVQAVMHERRMVPNRALSIDASEALGSSFGGSGSNSDDEGGGGGGGSGRTATATVAEGSGGSSTFLVERPTTVASGAKDHKVCIAVVELAPRFRYFTTPSLEAKAFLQVAFLPFCLALVASALLIILVARYAATGHHCLLLLACPGPSRELKLLPTAPERGGVRLFGRLLRVQDQPQADQPRRNVFGAQIYCAARAQHFVGRWSLVPLGSLCVVCSTRSVSVVVSLPRAACSLSLSLFFTQVFLGTDASVKVEHKLVKKSSSEGSAGGFMKTTKDSKLVYEYLTLVHNTKPSDSVEVSTGDDLDNSQ